MIAKKRNILKINSIGGYDLGFLILTLALSIIGWLSVADSSSPQALAYFNDSYFFAKQQLMWFGVGFLFMFVGAIIDYKMWKKYAVNIFLAVTALLLIVLIPGVGSKFLGARSWITFGFFSVQPSELAKLSLAIMIAYAADKKAPFQKVVMLIGFYACLIMLQPDLGTAIVVVGLGLAQLFISGAPILYFLGIVFSGGLISSILVLVSDYRRQRLLTFLESSADPLGTSYHVRQILLALGSGGLLGVGLGQSRQKQLFLPETASDSIFAVLAEEIGFIGSIFLILFLILFVLKIFKIASSAPDVFSKVLAAGIGVWIGGQVFLNLSSMVILTPLTGIPLPFFSYGGSSLVSIFLGIGILLNISKNTKK